ncbi:MAG: zinc ribbon domain-containing protein [Treponema sp.]|nr:zinc ribbon domain-containing protein [Treponema sp.]
MKKQSAKFFCESCGAEVPQNARLCSHCGRFFSSVRCPVCGESGNPNKFSNGCPKCGYAFEPNKKVNAPKTQSKSPSRKIRKRFLQALRMHDDRASRRREDESLPVWMYAVTGTFLLVFAAGIFVYFSK